MKLTMSKSIIFPLLAASTSWIVEAAPYIIGGDKAIPGDYPYFGKDFLVPHCNIESVYSILITNIH